MAKETLEKEDLDLIFDSLSERSQQLSEISRSGLTKSIRKIAKEEFDKTNKTWDKVERLLLKK